jgi:hypothetical protein
MGGRAAGERALLSRAVNGSLFTSAQRPPLRNRYSSPVVLVWFGVVIAAGALMVAYLLSRRNRVEYADLGTMSEQWLAEQRANDRPY